MFLELQSLNLLYMHATNSKRRDKTYDGKWNSHSEVKHSLLFIYNVAQCFFYSIPMTNAKLINMDIRITLDKYYTLTRAHKRIKHETMIFITQSTVSSKLTRNSNSKFGAAMCTLAPSCTPPRPRVYADDSFCDCFLIIISRLENYPLRSFLAVKQYER